jgi:hypothetical protein
MLRGTPDTEHTVHVTDDLGEPVPLSVLTLDLDPPNVGGWAAYMAGAASGSFSMTSAVCRSPAGFSARSASLGRGSGKQRNGKRSRLRCSSGWPASAPVCLGTRFPRCVASGGDDQAARTPSRRDGRRCWSNWPARRWMPAATARRPSGCISPAAARLPDVYVNGTAGGDSSPPQRPGLPATVPNGTPGRDCHRRPASSASLPRIQVYLHNTSNLPHGDRSDWSRAGITAGSGCASPATHVGYQLIGAGMMILAGGGNGVPLDYPELELWTRVG